MDKQEQIRQLRKEIDYYKQAIHDAQAALESAEEEMKELLKDEAPEQA